MRERERCFFFKSRSVVLKNYFLNIINECYTLSLFLFYNTYRKKFYRRCSVLVDKALVSIYDSARSKCVVPIGVVK